MAEMEKSEDVPQCDTCDTKLTKADFQTSERQRRFLDAYRLNPTIAPAARLAGIHRATVYRWLADPVFADAFKRASDAFFVEHRAKVIAENAARQDWRAARERRRWPMRCFNLDRARQTKYRWDY